MASSYFGKIPPFLSDKNRCTVKWSAPPGQQESTRSRWQRNGNTELSFGAEMDRRTLSLLLGLLAIFPLGKSTLGEPDPELKAQLYLFSCKLCLFILANFNSINWLQYNELMRRRPDYAKKRHLAIFFFTLASSGRDLANIWLIMHHLLAL